MLIAALEQAPLRSYAGGNPYLTGVLETAVAGKPLPPSGSELKPAMSKHEEAVVRELIAEGYIRPPDPKRCSVEDVGPQQLSRCSGVGVETWLLHPISLNEREAPRSRDAAVLIPSVADNGCGR
jgi:hypothetical protein